MSLGFIKYIVIIVVILVLIFLSQQGYLNFIGKSPYVKEAIKQANVFWTKAVNWFDTKVYPIITTEVAERGEQVKGEVEKQKKNFLQHAWETIEGYFKTKFSEFFGTELK